MTTAALLAVDGLAVHFGGLTAIEDLSLEVSEGEVLALIGPNGAGKTSAFNAITGYLAPSGGEMVFGGVRLNGLKPHRIAELGLVRTFQKTSVFGGRSALENILIGLHLRSTQQPLAILLGLPTVAREEKRLAAQAREILAFVGLGAREGELGSALPYGEQRLLEVAVALAAKPKLLLLDEQHGDAKRADLRELGHEARRFHRIHAGNRLVQQQQLRLRGERDRDFEQALLAVGQRAAQIARARAEPDERKDLARLNLQPLFLARDRRQAEEDRERLLRRAQV